MVIPPSPVAVAVASGGGGPPEAAPIAQSAATFGAISIVRTTFDRPLDANTGLTLSQWALTGSALHATKRTQQPYSIDVQGSDVVTRYYTACFQGETVTQAYTPGANPLKGANGKPVEAFSGLSVTNNSRLPAPIRLVNAKVAGSFTESPAGSVGSIIDLITAEAISTAGTAKLAYQATGLQSVHPCFAGNGSSAWMHGNLPVATAAALTGTNKPWTMAEVVDPVTPDAVKYYYELGAGNSSSVNTTRFGTNTTLLGVALHQQKDGGGVVATSGSNVNWPTGICCRVTQDGGVSDKNVRSYLNMNPTTDYTMSTSALIQPSTRDHESWGALYDGVVPAAAKHGFRALWSIPLGAPDSDAMIDLKGWLGTVWPEIPWYEAP